MGDFKHFTRPELAAEAGVDPWQIDQSLQAGDPGRVDAIADVVHRAGVAAGEVDGDFENARKRFRDAWVSDGSHSPIDESAEVGRIAESVGSHRDQLGLIATKYEEIAAALAVAQRDAGSEIGSLEQQLNTLDAQMDVADRLAGSDPQMARTMLDVGREQAVQEVRRAGEQLEGTRSGYAAVLSEASSVLHSEGAPLEIAALPAADPAATQATDDVKRLTDQAVLDQMVKVRSIQSALDKAAADAYVHGPGTLEGDAALAKVRDLKGELASALNDLGNIPDYSKLDPRAVTAGGDGHLLGDYLVNGQPVQLYGQLRNGSGQIFDQAKQTTYTFKDGKLVGQTRLDPGTVTPDDELLFNAVTAAVGAPEAAVAAKAAGEVGVQGLKRLLGREGFDLAASGVTSDNVIPRALAGAQLQADAAQARLGGLSHQLDPHPSIASHGRVDGDGLPPLGAGEHSTVLSYDITTEHAQELGSDPARGGVFVPAESQTALRIEHELGVNLSRAEAGQSFDWVDSTGRSYDALGNFPSKFFNAQWDNLQAQIVRHLEKAEIVPVDVSQFDATQRQMVREFVEGLDSRNVMIVGDQ